MFFSLNESLCNKDGICAKLCPSGIIQVDEATKYPYVNPRNEGKCIKCGQCSAFCPTCACEVQSIASERLEQNQLPTAESVNTLLRSRRSIRMFRKDLVPQGDIESLLAVAGMAPTATNMRSISWLVISGREQMVKIADLIVDYLETQDLSSYYKPLIKLYRNGNDVILRGASQLIISLRPNDWPWTEDGVIALTYLEIAAHSRGIGMCWAGFFTMAARNYKPLQDYLGIDGSYVCGAQMTGYPLLKTKKIPMRTPLDVKFR